MTTVTSSIRETVESTLSPSHLSYAGEAMSALEQREQQIVDGIRQAAQRYGLESSIVEDCLIEVGLVQRQTDEGSSSSDDDIASLRAEVVRLSNTIEAARQAASRHGIRF